MTLKPPDKDLQKRVRQWKKSLRVTESAFEKKAKKSWQRTLHPQTQSAFDKALRKSHRLMVGDHRLNTIQAMDWLKLLSPHLNDQWTFITDRFDKKQQQQVQLYLDGQCQQKKFWQSCGWQVPLQNCPEGGVGLVLEMVKKKKLKTIFMHPTGSFEQQTKRLYQKLGRVGAGEKLLIWTGSLKVAPVWAKQWLPQQLTPMMINMDSGSMYGRSVKPWLCQGAYWISTKHHPCINLELLRLWQDEKTVFVLPEQAKAQIHTYIHVFQDLLARPKKKIPFQWLSPFSALPSKILAGIDDTAKRFIETRMRKMESAVVPQENIVVVSRLDPASLAEEAMHFLRLHQRTEKKYGPWVTIWEEAWGMFGSLLIDPKREIENKEGKEIWESVHLIGYTLGQSMYEAWVKNRKRAAIREAFDWITVDEGEAERFVENMQILLWT
ncbi:MAG: hypothetical protein R3A45_01225 [Bdellovibrionota bacterium]